MQNRLRRNIFTITLINARSLKPKLDSLKKTLNELCTDVCLLTETWFQDSLVINMLYLILPNKLTMKFSGTTGKTAEEVVASQYVLTARK